MDVKNLLKSKNQENQIDISGLNISFDKTNIDFMDGSIKGKLEKASDEAYREITKEIVKVSSNQLFIQNQSKDKLKTSFTSFFKVLLSLQLAALFLIIVLNSVLDCFKLSDTVFITLVTSVFVETLGVVAVMVKYAYDSKQEVEILSILNAIVTNYQKYKDER